MDLLRRPSKGTTGPRPWPLSSASSPSSDARPPSGHPGDNPRVTTMGSAVGVSDLVQLGAEPCDLGLGGFAGLGLAGGSLFGGLAGFGLQAPGFSLSNRPLLGGFAGLRFQ